MENKVLNGASCLQVLVLNCGSSSLKFGLFEVSQVDERALVWGEVVGIGTPGCIFSAKGSSGRQVCETADFSGQEHVVSRVLALFKEWSLPLPDAVGHRIVHGGPNLRQHCLIDDRVVELLKRAAPFAPLHIPASLEIVGAARAMFPNALQAACFDTTFHASMPDVARVLPIPRELEAQGVFRYGFHGLSCESIVHQLGEARPDRLIIAHLGNGASVTAVKSGRSIDTSMGLTPTGGVMMGTRSGDVDPGVLLYLMREKHLNPARLEDLVDRRSGLLGVSGVSSDMQELQSAAPSSGGAQLAVAMFAYQIRKQIASMVGVLGGVDALVFTGGIGENDAALRTAICEGLECMGIYPDNQKAAPLGPDRPCGSNCRLHVLPSQEDEQIARHTRALTHLKIPRLTNLD